MFTIAVSPCSNPELTLEEALQAYSGLGYRRFELFTSWAKSAVDPTRDPAELLALAARHGFAFSSIHLPPMDDDLDASVARAARMAEFGSRLGCRVALVKAATRANHIAGGPRLLDAIEHLPILPVLQNHAGTAISTLDDYREVLAGVADERMKCTLEVGHFHTVGVSWEEGYGLLQGRLELVHIKDQIGPQSVPFGTGEIDLAGLLPRLAADGYGGDVVIEMEVEDRENTLAYLREALAYVKERLPA
jgi:sugar phosphate isomerase/epimerase